MTNTKSGPVEIWLRQGNLRISCEQVSEDESTTFLDVDSFSMRGAQREITGYFLSQGYRPDGRWQTTAEDHGDTLEAMRRFKPEGP